MATPTMSIQIGPVALAFSFPRKQLAETLGKRYSGYESRRSHPDIVFVCQFIDAAVPNDASRVHVESLPDGSRRVYRGDFECIWNAGRGTMCVAPSVFAFDAALRVILATILPSRKAFLLHASAVVENGSALVFPGVSGAGKSTICRLAGKRRVLNDEIVVIQATRSAHAKVGATPFWGELGTGPSCSRSFPVRSFCFPSKSSKRLCAEPLELHRALQDLLRCVCTFSHTADDHRILLATAAEVISDIPVYALYFQPDPSFWDVPELAVTTLSKTPTAFGRNSDPFR